jgi:hypothetical protein
MWGMDFINAPKLWSRLPAVPNEDDQLATARFAMVIDSGVFFQHADFSAPSGSTVDRSLSRTFNSDSLSMTDQGLPGNDVADGHGTHVAGILAAGWGAGDDRGIAGVVGAKARLASCRIFSDHTSAVPSQGTTLDEIRCLEHATQTKAFVVNFSGGDYYTPAESVALEALRAAVQGFCASASGLLVVSAGNDQKNLSDDPMYPAAFAGQPGTECVVAVAAVAQGGYMPWFSNYGSQVKVAAPGDWVASDWVAVSGALAAFGEEPALNGTNRAWTSLSGTSMAAPFVSGAALLLGNAFPKATSGQVRACLEESGAAPARALGDASAVPFDNPLITPPNQDGFISGGALDVDAAYDCVAKRVAGVTTCSPAKIVVDAQKGDEGLSCGTPALASLPASAFSPKPDVSYSLRPPGPYKPGLHLVSVVPADGSAGCIVQLEVKPCRLQCATDDVVLRHKDSGCAPSGAPFPAAGSAAALATVVAPPGVSYTASPPGPYLPNRRTTVTLTASDGSPSCQITFDVKPCGVTCNPSVVRVPQSFGGGSCAPGGAGAAFPEEKAILVLDAPNVGYTLSPPGPYAVGSRAVKVTPNTGAPSCYVSLVVESCKLSCAATAAASLDAPSGGGGGCVSSVPFPTSAIGAGAGVTYTLTPPGPFKTPGTYDVVAKASPGGDTCTTRLTVAPCSSGPPPATIACAPQPVSVQLRRGSGGGCDGANVPPTDLYTSTGGVTATVSPPGPYAPGTTTVHVTPSPGSPATAVACDATVVVSPCAAECADLTVPADAGKCFLSALPATGFVVDASKGRTATGVVVANPPPPFAVGATRVSAAVVYPGNVRSAASPQCTLTVTDTQKPTSTALTPCLYPEGTGAYASGATEACLSADQLLSAFGDNCAASAVSLSVAKCANVSPSANGSTACRVATGNNSVCVALRRLPNATRTPRVVAVTVRLTDASGNASEVVARVRVFRRRPTSGADASCLRVNSTGALVRRNTTPISNNTGLTGRLGGGFGGGGDA